MASLLIASRYALQPGVRSACAGRPPNCTSNMKLKSVSACTVPYDVNVRSLHLLKRLLMLGQWGGQWHLVVAAL